MATELCPFCGEYFPDGAERGRHIRADHAQALADALEDALVGAFEGARHG